MLGSVAKKMRILGFDCKYFSTIDDDELIVLAGKEDRTVLTMDRMVLQKCAKLQVPAIGVLSHSENDQLAEIARATGLKRYEFDAEKARCPLCNGTVKPVEKDLIVAKLPQKIASHIDKFWQCSGCGHIYWEGTHIRNLKELIGEINAALQDIR